MWYVLKKKKVSIDFYEAVLDKLLKYRKRIAAPSNSVVVNYVLDSTLNLSDEVKEALAQCCAAQIRSLNQGLKTAGEFERNKAECTKNEYKKLIDFFTDGKGIAPEQTSHMKKVSIIDGYVIFPNDWIITKYQNPENCKYVGVVEAKSISNDPPYFIVFSTKPIHKITTAEYDEILHYCCMEYPALKDNKEQAPAIFAINEQGQPGTTYPFGAMIIRTNQKKGVNHESNRNRKSNGRPGTHCDPHGT